MVESSPGEEAAATELAGVEPTVIVLCIVETMVETVVYVLVEVMLPEVTIVLSVQVVSSCVVAGTTAVEYTGGDEGTTLITTELLETAATELDAGGAGGDDP